MDFSKQPTISPILPPKSNDWGWKYISPRQIEKKKFEIMKSMKKLIN